MKLFRVYIAYDNYDDFHHINNIIFSQNFISLLLGLFNDEIDLREVIIGLFLYEDFLKDDILACVET
jgi:hypothetical protein